MGRVIDCTGLVFGKLTAKRYVGPDNSHASLWEFSCECGNEPIIRIKDVKRGHTRSCGCEASKLLSQRNAKHGLSREHPKTYRSWKDMRSRCNNPRNTDWHNYGGRGISVCARWDSFEQFFEDMGPRPDGMTIDRIDTSGNYEYGNCRWATAETQANNKRTNHIVGDEGETLSQAARRTGVKRETIAYRIKHGLSPFEHVDYRK